MPARLETLQVQLLNFVRCRLQDHLKLVMLEEPIGILAKSPVGRPPRWLHVGDAPVVRPKHPQERLRVHRPGTHFDVERLLEQTSA